MTHRPQIVRPKIANLKAHYQQAYEQAIYEVYNGQETIRVQIGEYCLPLDFLMIQGNSPQGLADEYMGLKPLFGIASQPYHPQSSLTAQCRFMDRHGWAIITAFNPYSQTLTEPANQQRHQRLIEHLQKLQLTWLAALGRDQAGVWTPEPSLWIPRIERLEAIAIGRRFEQNAIVYGELNQPAELQWL